MRLIDRTNAAWLGAVVVLSFALVSLCHVAFTDFGSGRHEAVNVDELFFSMCAARGIDVGQIPISACHNNKAPLIVFVHQLVQLVGGTYNLLAVRVAAYLVVGLLVGVAGRVAFLLGGSVAAVAAMGFAIQALSAQPTFLALKTETVGTLFTLASVASLLRPGHRSDGRALTSGILMGIALVTKQTYVLSAAIAMLWILVASRACDDSGTAKPLRASLVFGIGVVMPFVTFLVIFFIQGQAVAFLGSYFVYPAVYGPAAAVPMVWRVFWGAMPVLGTLSTMTLLTVSCAMVVVAMPGLRSSDAALRRAAACRLLVAPVAIALLAVPLLSPLFFSNHIVPFVVTMATLCGLVVAEAGQVVVLARYVTPVLFVTSALMATQTWSGDRGGGVDQWRNRAAHLEGVRGRHAYVLGMWPDFYVSNGLVPSSNILYPAGVPGVPDNFFFTAPDPGSLKGRALAWVRERNAVTMMSEFRQTPPSYIVLVHAMSRFPGSTSPTDVPLLNDYLDRHCVFDSNLLAPSPVPGDRTSSLFRCADGQ